MEIKSFKTKHLKVVFFKLPIYESRILIIKHDGNKGYYQALDFFKKIGLNSVEDHRNDDDRNCFGFVLQERIKSGLMNFVILNMKREYRPEIVNTISHEVTHLIDNLSKYHGLQRYKTGNNEHIAYLTGYLTDTIYKI